MNMYGKGAGKGVRLHDLGESEKDVYPHEMQAGGGVTVLVGGSPGIGGGIVSSDSKSEGMGNCVHLHSNGFSRRK